MAEWGNDAWTGDAWGEDAWGESSWAAAPPSKSAKGGKGKGYKSGKGKGKDKATAGKGKDGKDGDASYKTRIWHRYRLPIAALRDTPDRNGSCFYKEKSKDVPDIHFLGKKNIASEMSKDNAMLCRKPGVGWSEGAAGAKAAMAVVDAHDQLPLAELKALFDKGGEELKSAFDTLDRNAKVSKKKQSKTQTEKAFKTVAEWLQKEKRGLWPKLDAIALTTSRLYLGVMHLKQMLHVATKPEWFAKSLPDFLSEDDDKVAKFVENPKSSAAFVKAMVSQLMKNFESADAEEDNIAAMLAAQGAAADDSDSDSSADTKEKKKKRKGKKADKGKSAKDKKEAKGAKKKSKEKKDSSDESSEAASEEASASAASEPKKKAAKKEKKPKEDKKRKSKSPSKSKSEASESEAPSKSSDKDEKPPAKKKAPAKPAAAAAVSKKDEKPAKREASKGDEDKKAKKVKVKKAKKKGSSSEDSKSDPKEESSKASDASEGEKEKEKKKKQKEKEQKEKAAKAAQAAAAAAAKAAEKEEREALFTTMKMSEAQLQDAKVDSILADYIEAELADVQAAFAQVPTDLLQKYDLAGTAESVAAWEALPVKNEGQPILEQLSVVLKDVVQFYEAQGKGGAGSSTAAPAAAA